MASQTLRIAGTVVPAIGQGTWYLGDDASARTEEIATLRRGIELGMTLVDTAEMYGNGRSERLVGEAIAPMRDEVFLVDKVLPSHASAHGTIAACQRSLRALGTDRIDLYLLHWPGSYPLEETVGAFHTLIQRGLIRSWGVSNFDPADLAGLAERPAVNQILYNPYRRGVEFDLLPAMRQRGILAMAYSPVEQGRLLRDQALAGIAAARGVSIAQVLLAWAIRSGDAIAIPKASSLEHVEENAAAASLVLAEDELALIDAAYPGPRGPVPLQML